MIFEYTIAVRSQTGKDMDCGHALERVAFFPGVTHAQLLARDTDSVTIGYNGRPPSEARRDFCAELNAEGLIADGVLWEAVRRPSVTKLEFVQPNLAYRSSESQQPLRLDNRRASVL